MAIANVSSLQVSYYPCKTRRVACHKYHRWTAADEKRVFGCAVETAPRQQLQGWLP